MLSAIKNALVRFEAGVAVISLLLLLLFSIIQILARNLFETGFPELEVISRHLVLFVMFSGAALVVEHNRHIKIDVLASALSDPAKHRLVRPFLLISAAVCFAFAWYATQFWLDEWEYAPVNARLSVYLALGLPLGFLLLGLHLLLLAILGGSDASTKAGCPGLSIENN